MLCVCEGIPVVVVVLFTLQLCRDRALRAESDTKKKFLGDNYKVSRIKINATEIREGPPHVASTYDSSTNSYDQTKNQTTPKTISNFKPF
jgi:hypothetical protein